MLEEVLKKIGVSEYGELNDFEKQTFDSWQSVLSTKELTVQGIKKFIESQLSINQKEIMKFDNSVMKDIYLKAVIRNLTALDIFLNEKERTKKHLAKQLSEKFNI